jgi:hypothetical protein
MEKWEFLLQKEGDRSWLPLDSPDVEILEDRYRIVARSSRINTTVEVCVSHLLTTDETPPKRRVQKRTSQTNPDGLMVVIPFTRLQAGVWELRCASTDVMSDLLGSGWQHSVRLQVVARQPEEEWEPEWASPATVPPVSELGEMAHTNGSHATIAPDAAPDPVSETESPVSADPTSTPDLAATPSVLNPEVAEILGASMERLFQITEQLSDQLLDEVLRADSTIVEAKPDFPETVMGFAIELERQTLLASRGEEITVCGKVTPIAIARTSANSVTNQNFTPVYPGAEASDPWEAEAAPPDLNQVTPNELQLCLRDPQTLQVLISDRQPLSHQPANHPFSFRFILPRDIHTRLVMGEVLLCGSFENNPVVIATQAFSITVDPRELIGEMQRLSTVLAEEREEQAADPASTILLPLTQESLHLAAKPAFSLDLSFLDLVTVEPVADQPPRFPSLAGQPLPPRIYQPDPNQPRQRSLELPKFTPDNQTVEPVPEDSLEIFGDEPLIPTQAEAIVQPATTPDLDSTSLPESDVTEKVEPVAATATEPMVPEAIAVEESVEIETAPVEVPAPDLADAIVAIAEEVEIGAIADPEADPDTATSSEADPDAASSGFPPEEPCPIQKAFQALRLQERFFSRLTSLATESKPVIETKPEPVVAAVIAATPTAVRTVLAPDTEFLAHEIVVDDEPLPPRNGRHSSNQSTNSSSKMSTEPDDQPNPLVLPEDESVPKPSLEVATGELIAGQSMQIRVKLPDLLPRIYVKLWVIDCQTRALLEPPHWLVDFTPNGFGALESHLQLTVPFGSIEVQFEAIAVEIQTQRESHKVVVTRKVIPADLPLVAIDPFDL